MHADTQSKARRLWRARLRCPKLPVRSSINTLVLRKGALAARAPPRAPSLAALWLNVRCKKTNRASCVRDVALRREPTRWVPGLTRGLLECRDPVDDTDGCDDTDTLSRHASELKPGLCVVAYSARLMDHAAGGPSPKDDVESMFNE